MPISEEFEIDNSGLLFSYTGSGQKKITIPSEVKTVGKAFRGHTEIEEVVVPQGVEKIGKNAFTGCKNLTKITLPEGLTSISWEAFEDCSSLPSIEIPSTVKEFGWSAFKNCSSLTSIKVPHGVPGISYAVFQGCTRLTHVELPTTINEIGVSAFAGCSRLVMDIPSHVTFDISLLVFDEDADIWAPKVSVLSVPEPNKWPMVAGFCRAYLAGETISKTQTNAYLAYLKKNKKTRAENIAKKSNILRVLTMNSLLTEKDTDELLTVCVRSDETENAAILLEYKQKLIDETDPFASFTL